MMSYLEILQSNLDLFSVLNTIEQSYSFLTLDKITKENLYSRAAAKVLAGKSLDVNRIYGVFKRTFNEYICEQFINGDYTILKNFLKDIDDNSIISSLSSFFYDISYTFNIDMALYILDLSKVYACIDNLYTKYKDVIPEKGIETISANSIVIALIYAYCVRNDIKLDDELYIESLNIKNKKDKGDIYNEDAVKQWFNLIPKTILTRDEEIHLAKQWKAGDNKAKEMLIKHNFKLVISIANKYKNAGVQLADLIQEGNIGLIKAVNNFDVNKGCKLSTYATWWIRDAINNCIADKQEIKIPLNVQKQIKNLNRIAEKLEIQLNRYPTVEEIAKEMKISKSEVKELQLYYQTSSNVISYDAPIGEDEKSTLLEVMEIPSKVSVVHEAENNILKEEIFDIIKEVLNQREIDIICSRYALNSSEFMTHERLGEKYDITRARVQQIEKKALIKLNKALSQIKYTDNINLSENKSDNPIINKPNKREDDIYKKLQNSSETQKEFIKKVLSAQQLDLLLKKFGENINVINSLLPAQEKLFCTKVLPFLNNLFNLHKGYYYYDSIFDYTKDELLKFSAFYKLPLRYRRVLLEVYGEDLSSSVTYKSTPSRIKTLQQTIIPKIKENNERVSLNDFENYKNIFKGDYNLNNLPVPYVLLLDQVFSTHYIEMVKEEKYNPKVELIQVINFFIKLILSSEEIKILNMKFGLENNVSFINNKVVAYTGLTEEKVNYSFYNSLSKLLISPHLKKILIYLQSNTMIENIEKKKQEIKIEEKRDLYSFFEEDDIKYLNLAIGKLNADEILFLHSIFFDGFSTKIFFKELTNDNQYILMEIIYKLQNILRYNNDINLKKVFCLSQVLYNETIFNKICVSLAPLELDIFKATILASENGTMAVDYVSCLFNMHKRDIIKIINKCLETILRELEVLSNQNTRIRALLKDNKIKVGSCNE